MFSKKLNDALPSFLNQPQKDAYVTAVSVKIKLDADKITVGDVVSYQWTLEHVTLDLGKKKLSIKHVRKGCLEVTYSMPTRDSLNAYKMVLCNRHKFYSIDLMCIQIGKHPLIYDPWLSDLEIHSVKQTQHHGKLLYSNNYVQCLY